MPIETITYPCSGAGIATGTETGFVVWGTIFDPKVKYGFKPSQGAIYNKVTDSWTTMSLLAANVYAVNTHRQSQLVGGTIYAYGQAFLDESQPAEQDLFFKIRTVARYHINSDSWDFLTPVGFPSDRRSYTGFIAVDNELYLFGGIDGPQNANIIHKDGVRLALPGSKP